MEEGVDLILGSRFLVKGKAKKTWYAITKIPGAIGAYLFLIESFLIEIYPSSILGLEYKGKI